MTALRTDRFLRLIEPPAYLAVLGPRDRTLWRVAIAPVLVVAAVILAGFVVQTATSWFFERAAATAGLTCPDSAGLTCSGLLMWQNALWFAPASLAVLAVLALLMGRRMMTWVSAAGRVRWRLFGLGLVGAGLILAPIDWASLSLFNPGATPPLAGGDTLAAKALYILACAACLPVWALFEEVLFRGWLLQQFAALTRNLAGMLLVDSLIFALSHGQSDPGANLSHLVFGLALGWSVLRLGGLELAIGVHAANNLLIALFVQTILQGQTEATANWAQTGLDLAGSLAILILVELVARVPALAAWAGVNATAAAAPGPSAPEAIPEAHP